MIENTSVESGPVAGAGLTPWLQRHCTTNIRNRIPKTKIEQDGFGADRDLYSGLVRLHVLHRAAKEHHGPRHILHGQAELSGPVPIEARN